MGKGVPLREVGLTCIAIIVKIVFFSSNILLMLQVITIPHTRVVLYIYKYIIYLVYITPLG